MVEGMTTNALDAPGDVTPKGAPEPPTPGSVAVFWWERPFLTHWLSLFAGYELLGSYVLGMSKGGVAPALAETMNGRLVAMLTTEPPFKPSWFLGLGLLLYREQSERLERLLGWAGYLGLFALSAMVGNLGNLLGVAEPTGLAAPFLCVILASSAWTQDAPPRPVGAEMLAWSFALFLGLLSGLYALTDGRTWAFSTSASAIVGTLIVRHQARRRWSTPPTDAPTAEASR